MKVISHKENTNSKNVGKPILPPHALSAKRYLMAWRAENELMSKTNSLSGSLAMSRSSCLSVP